MRICLTLFLLVSIYLPAYSQESVPEMNDRALETTTPLFSFSKSNHTSSSFPKVTYIKEQSIYFNKSTVDLQHQLLNTRNREIIMYVNKAKKNRRREFAAFAALPLGIAAAACIRQNQISGNWLRPAGLTFFAASLSCIIISPIAYHRKNINYKRAVKLYNAYF
jgi:hypothetical protein